MNKLLLAAAVVFMSGCAAMLGGKDPGGSEDFDKEASAADISVKETRARASLAKIETSLADYAKTENGIPPKLEKLVPKYLAGIPSLDLPACGRETDKVEVYPAIVLRDGQVDGSRIKGTGRWGYVFNDNQVVVFIDCLKASSRGTPWYQERGVY